jgi:hypothetical protein
MPKRQAAKFILTRTVTVVLDHMAIILSTTALPRADKAQGARPVEVKGDSKVRLRTLPAMTSRPVSHVLFVTQPIYVALIFTYSRREINNMISTGLARLLDFLCSSGGDKYGRTYL